MQSSSDLQSLAVRVERLEKQYRLLNSEVVTEKLALVDSDGQTRATLRMSEGVPSLILYDENGNVRAILRVSAEGPALHLLASETRAGLELTVSEAGPDVSLFDASGKQRLSLNVFPFLDELGTPRLVMRNTNGTASIVLTAVVGRGSINLSDAANSDTAIRLQIDNEGPIVVCVRDGKVLWSAP